MTDIPEISIVIPCYNEEENARPIYEAVRDQITKYTDSFEILFIDNFSTDRTREILREVCAADSRVWAIFNTRNFGQMRSPTHAIYQARGRAVIAMCADFQDSPELIGEFVQRWRAGAQIVLGVRKSEKTSAGLSAVRRFGYSFLERNADYPVIPGATGFGLFDRIVVDTLARWKEPEPFFRGMLVESGFRYELVPFDRPERLHGTTKNGFRELLDFATSGLAGSAKGLLRRPIVWSLGFMMLAAMLFLGTAISTALGYGYWLGLILAVQVALFAANFLFMGLIGEQVRVIGERTREVPLVIEQERVNGPAPRRITK